MSRRFARCRVGIFVAALAGSVHDAQAFYGTHVPLTAAELLKRVPMVRVAMESAEPEGDFRVGPATVTPGPGGFSIWFKGSDRSGQPWRFEGSLGYWGATGPSFWLADLDGSGTRDLICLWNTGGNGLAPPRGLTVLLLDEMGRPVPWSLTGYFEEDEQGIRDFLDLDGDGRAELIQMGFDDGYWITSAYEADRSRWKLRRTHAGRTFPLYTRFTHRPNHRPTIPTKERFPFEPDLSNDSTGNEPTRRLLGVEWGPDDRADSLLLSDGTVCTPIDGTFTLSILVVERAGGRKIGPLGTREMLEEIAREEWPIRVAGQGRRGECTPVLVWVEAP